ncbi:hypothetical protein [Alistipes sp.]|uniref:hypothetical protein n=1 Tax=Alistipes sp. TaxID=1872444 RepID=UPI003AF0F197
MKSLYFLLIALGISGMVTGTPPQATNGSYIYSIRFVDVDNNPLRGVSILVKNMDVGSVSSSSGTATMLANLLQPADTLEVTKPGYISQYLFFDEKSDGTATVVLKKDPNAPAQEADDKSGKGRSGKKRNDRK